MAQLNISLPDSDLIQIKRDAANAGTSISLYVRAKVLNRMSMGPWNAEEDENRFDEFDRRISTLERLAERSGASL